MIELIKAIKSSGSIRTPQPVEVIKKTQTVRDERKEQPEKAETVKETIKAAVAEDLDKSELEELTTALNDVMKALRLDASFWVDERTERFVVSLTNGETGEVIRQIPPEELLEMAARLKEVAVTFAAKPDLSGVLVDQKL